MPFGFGKSNDCGGSLSYQDLEHAPLSAANDDEDDMPLPPYSDAPPSKSFIAGDDDKDDEMPTNGRRRNGAGGRNGKRNGHKAASQDRDVDRGYDDDDDDDDDDGYGEGDWAGDRSPMAKIRARSKAANKPKRYRMGLICAYWKHWFMCKYCNCYPRSDSKSRRNIGGPYGPANNSKCRKGVKRALKVLMYLVLLAVIVLCAAGIGYIFAQDGSPFSPKETDISAVTDVDGNSNNKLFGKNKNIQIGKLPPPPDDLHDICTDWITAAGNTKCQTECNAAKCCALPAKDKDSCWEDQATECATYRAACMALELHGGDDFGGNSGGSFGGAGSGGTSNELLDSKVHLESPLPSYLAQVCSSSSLQRPEGFDQCSGVCRPSRCCHPFTYGCEVINEDKRWCDAYEKPCAGVAESWRGSGHAVGSNNTDTSATTSAGGEQDTVTNPVILQCNTANLNPPTACIEACKMGACCYKSNSYPPIEKMFQEQYGNSSPFRTVKDCSANVGFCQQFGACEHLNHLKDTSGWHSDDVTYELDIASVCKPEYIAQFGALECSNVCQPAHCCFSGEYKCDDVQLGHLECEDYSLCSVLYPTYKSTEELFKMAKNIDDMCSETSLKTTNGLSKCQSLCKDKLCCFEQGAYGCANDPGQNCLAYAGCDALVTTHKSAEDWFQMAKDIDEACSEDSLVTSSGRSKCQLMCEDKFCCFESGEYGCAEDKTQNCLAYAGCETLVIAPPSTHSNQGKQPNTNDVTTVKKTGGDVSNEVDEFITALETACSVTSLVTLIGIHRCHNKCQTHLCCFTQDATLAGNDCSNMNVEACSAYKPCETLVTPKNKAKNPPSLIKSTDLVKVAASVEAACALPMNTYDVDESWVTACHQVCASRLCCLVDAKIGSNCRAQVGYKECNAYSACEVLINNNGKEITTAEGIEDRFGDLETVCNAAVLQDSKLYDVCKDRCNERSCCFEEQTQYSCYHMEKDWCNEFKACSFVDFAFTDISGLTSNQGGSGSSSQLSGTPNANNAPTPTINSGPATPPSHSSSVQQSFKNLCSESNLRQNFDNCQNMCQEYECCFRSENSCYNERELECDDYYICEEFYTDDSILNDINVDQPMINAPNSKPSPIPAGGSSNGSLSLPTESMEIEHDFDTMCTPSLLVQNWHICKGICSKFECCFRSPETSCYGMNKQECDNHSICEEYNEDEQEPNGVTTNNAPVVKPTTTTDASSQLTFETLCKPSTLVQNWNTCKDHCSRYECCFTTNDSCYEKNQLECDEYFICEEFYLDKEEAETISESQQGYSIIVDTGIGTLEAMTYRCVPNHLEQNLKVCSEWCTPYECCFYSSNSCYTSNQEVCDVHHDVCKSVFDYTDEFGGGPSNNAQPSNKELGDTQLGTTKMTQSNNIDDLCNSEVSSNKELFSNCKQKCQERSCCFEVGENAAYSCYQADKDWCDEYEACKLVGLTGVDASGDNI